MIFYKNSSQAPLRILINPDYLCSRSKFKAESVSLIKSISGIRGTIGGKTGDNLTPLDVVKFTAAFGTLIKRSSTKTKIVIGRDARMSGEMVSSLVCSTLQGLGIDVVDLGLSTTPTVEIAVPLEKPLEVLFSQPAITPHNGMR